MPEQIYFSCPCCGMHAPIGRLEAQPFPLAKFRKELGGKLKLSDEAREMREGLDLGRGSAPGRLVYEEIELDEEIREALKRRIEQLTILY